MRDVVQNHLLQVLALVAMELPATFGADDIRDEKLKLLRSVRALAPEDALYGQYRGYRQAEGVAADSRTPTYVALKLLVDNWRWQGVPFYIRAGKGLARRTTEVSIHFQQIPYCLFGREDVCQLIEPNVLVLRIQPDEGIALSVATKVPGRGPDRRQRAHGLLVRGRLPPRAGRGLREAAARRDARRRHAVRAARRRRAGVVARDAAAARVERRSRTSRPLYDVGSPGRPRPTPSSVATAAAGGRCRRRR